MAERKRRGVIKPEKAKPVSREKVKRPIKKAAAPAEKEGKLLERALEEEKISPEVKVEESKYYAGPVLQKFEAEKEFDFPAGYGDNKIILLVRDPHWVYAYWEVNEKRITEIKNEIGEEILRSSRECLRIYNVANWDFFDIEVVGGARNWYIRVPLPNTSYCVDIGYKTSDGRFIAAARSNVVTVPLDRMSDIVDEQWMVPDWDKLYSLSGGFGIGLSSGEVKELWKKRFESEAASGWVSSGAISSPGMKKAGERPFWLWVKTDLIVYGATEPTATLTIQGRKVNLRPDGTFSIRYELPEGKYFFPVEATRDDGQERRKITPIVERAEE